MIGLATQTFSATGAVLLTRTRADSDIYGLGRRVSRVATLDGGVVLTDNGHAAGDRDLQIVADRVDVATHRAVEALVKNYGQLMVSTDAGCFLGAVEAMNYRDGKLQLKILVSEQLNA